MANICNNEIIVRGNLKQVEKFKDFILNLIKKDEGCLIWGDECLFCVAVDPEISLDSDCDEAHSFTIYGESKWDSPLKLFRHMSKTHSVTMEIFYYEQGCDFSGIYECGGDSESESTYTYLEGFLEYHGYERFKDVLMFDYNWESARQYSDVVETLKKSKTWGLLTSKQKKELKIEWEAKS